MSSVEELMTSIEQYKLQIAQIDGALKYSSTIGTERDSLINLLADLNELLALTQESLDATVNPVPVSKSIGTDQCENDTLADEMRLFMDEIKECQKESTSNSDDSNDQKTDKQFNEIKETFNELVGKKCLAPHLHSWGSVTYHNAFVCGLDDTTEYNENELDKIKVRIFFTNPTHQEMIPCSYYLDGNCRFDAGKCRFSHGELVLYSDLKEYREPDFSVLSKSNTLVLAKQNDRIWYKARVVSSDFDRKICRLKMEKTRKDVDCPFEEILPMTGDKNSIDLESDSDYSNTDEIDDYEEIHRARLIEQSLLNPSSDQALGEWEKHTKGFGSKMMKKYGYIHGTGLGHDGSGIIIPISAQILPPGRSLDHCMELREQANGDQNLFSVERKLKKIQKKQEVANERAYERERKNVDVFSFINENIFASQSAPKTMAKVNNVTDQRFENHSTKTLNVTGFKLAEDIRRKEKEIQKIKESLGRHQNGSTIYGKLKEQLREKTAEMERLQNTENNLAKEQNFRKNKSKLSVF